MSVITLNERYSTITAVLLVILLLFYLFLLVILLLFYQFSAVFSSFQLYSVRYSAVFSSFQLFSWWTGDFHSRFQLFLTEFSCFFTEFRCFRCNTGPGHPCMYHSACTPGYTHPCTCPPRVRAGMYTEVLAVRTGAHLGLGAYLAGWFWDTVCVRVSQNGCLITISEPLGQPLYGRQKWYSSEKQKTMQGSGMWAPGFE